MMVHLYYSQMCHYVTFGADRIYKRELHIWKHKSTFVTLFKTTCADM